MQREQDRERGRRADSGGDERRDLFRLQPLPQFVFNGGKVTLGAFITFSPNTDTINRKAFLSVLGEHRSASALHTACQLVFASIGRPITEENREIYFFILHRR